MSRRGAGAAIFSVGVDDVQVNWRALPAGTVELRAGTRQVTVAHPGGAGAATIDGLPAASTVTIRVSATGEPGFEAQLTARTLAPPPGAVRCRIATISDLHIGEQAFGYFSTIAEVGAAEPYAVRCTRAAIAEAEAWGADLLVVKGDAADQSYPELWEQTIALLDEARVPVMLLPGNHESKARRTMEPRAALRGTAISLVDHGVAVRDLPGVRVILGDTTRHGRDIGGLDRVRAGLLDAAAAAPAGVLLLTHHHLARRPVYTELPFGVPKGTSDRFLAALGRAHAATLVSSGHTHRHRRDRVGPVTVTTVGSVKDYPGVWAGYVVHDGGIVQTVRRVAEPSAMAWTEHSARAMGGIYRYWTPGRLDDRCFSLNW